MSIFILVEISLYEDERNEDETVDEPVVEDSVVATPLLLFPPLPPWPTATKNSLRP